MLSVSIICFSTFVIKGALTEVNIFERDLDSLCDSNLDSGVNVVVPNQEYMPSYGASHAVGTKNKREPLIHDSSALQDVKSASGEAEQFDPLNDVANQMMFENSNPMVSETRDSFSQRFDPMEQASYGTLGHAAMGGRINSKALHSSKYSNSLIPTNALRLKQIMEYNNISPKISRSRRSNSRGVELSTDGNPLLSDLSLDSLQEPIIINRKLSWLRSKPAVRAGAHDTIRESRGIGAGKNRRSLMYGINTDVLMNVMNRNEESGYNKAVGYSVSDYCGCSTTTTKCTTPCTTKCTTPTVSCTTKCTTPCTTPCTTKCTTPCTTPCTTKCTTPCTTKCTTPCPKHKRAHPTPVTYKGAAKCTTPCTSKTTTCPTTTSKCTTPCTTPTTACTTPCTTPTTACTTPCTTPTTACTTPCTTPTTACTTPCTTPTTACTTPCTTPSSAKPCTTPCTTKCSQSLIA